MEFVYDTVRSSISSRAEIVYDTIDIGSGPHPIPGADIRMDIHQWPGVNLIHSLLDTPYPFDDNTFKVANMGDVVEHISIFDIDRVLTEVCRILKPDGKLIVTVPDAAWIFERIVNKDWKEHANVDWLNPTDDPWKNAMSYLFGGFHNKDEYQLEGMGHLNAFNQNSLKELLEKNGFMDCNRYPDMRNPEPARNAVIKMVCRKA
jgi:predicted SAM-dependent methyltransferase